MTYDVVYSDASPDAKKYLDILIISVSRTSKSTSKR